jgi:exopolysaccharide biosynthesis polyprenyl glycosylphosphotransferase
MAPVLYGEEMSISRRREALILFLGDVFSLSVGLVATLLVRYSEIPDARMLAIHFVPFSFLFLASTVVFFIAGLYEKHTLVMKAGLPATVFYAQLANIVLGAAFFFFVPFFEIQPKGFLFIYLLLSTACLSLWRMYVFPLVSMRRAQPALLVGTGAECAEILEEVNGNTRYAIRFAHFMEVPGPALTGAAIAEKIIEHKATAVVMPAWYLKNPDFMAEWNVLQRSGVQFIDAARLYEELFDRVALHLIDERVFFLESPFAETAVYAALKRITDIALSAIALVVLSPLLLIVALILKISEGRNAVIFQTRVGKNNAIIKIIKFRTMLFDDGGDPEKQKKNRVTRFGAFLRKTRLDELPQFWNILAGDLSLIGPRPEIPSLVAEYEKQIPFYAARHMIQPGMSGWAQIKHASPPKWKLDVEATRNKLSYDLYYLKNRSVALDSMISLRTIQILLSRAGT